MSADNIFYIIIGPANSRRVFRAAEHGINSDFL